MDCVYLLTAHWTAGRRNGVMSPSYGLLDLTVYGRPGASEDSAKADATVIQRSSGRGG
jgi:hypothetical protein